MIRKPSTKLISSDLMKARDGFSEHATTPALKLWMPCNETSGEIMSDTQQGVSWTPNDEDEPTQSGKTIVGNASAGTIQVQGINPSLDFDGFLPGDTFTISNGDGDTGLRGTYTFASKTAGNTCVVSEAVIDGQLVTTDYKRNGSRGNLQFDAIPNTVYPAMTDSITDGVTRTPAPVLFRTGSLPTIPAGSSFLIMYVARVVTDAAPTGFDAGYGRIAFGDANNFYGTGEAGIGLAGNNFHTAFFDDSGDDLLGNIATLGYINSTLAGKDVIGYLKYTHSVGADYSLIDMADNSTLLTADSWSGAIVNAGYVADTITLGESFNYLRTQGLAFYGVAWYIYQNVPTDLDYAIQWNGWAWKNGYKVPYPGAKSWT